MRPSLRSLAKDVSFNNPNESTRQGDTKIVFVHLPLSAETADNGDNNVSDAPAEETYDATSSEPGVADVENAPTSIHIMNCPAALEAEKHAETN